MPDSTKTAPASAKVFAIPELLEAILLHLPLQELLTTASLINKTFHATIAASHKLQEVLFLKTIPWSQLHRSKRLPPIVTFSEVFKIASRLQEYMGSKMKMPPYIRRESIVVNPFLRLLTNGASANAGRRRRDAVCHPDASWRRMFATQPPTEISLDGKVVVRFGDVETLELSVLRNLPKELGGVQRFTFAHEMHNVLRGSGECRYGTKQHKMLPLEEKIWEA